MSTPGQPAPDDGQAPPARAPDGHALAQPDAEGLASRWHLVGVDRPDEALRQAIMQPLLAHNAALAGPSGMRSLAVAVHDLDAGGPRDAGATLGQGAGGGTATGAGFGVVAGKAGPVPGDARSALPPAAGGLWGVTHHGWLYVQMLLVPEAARGTGLGTRLMRAAEAMAVQRGCHAAWVDTQFGARGFYERLGYAVFGELRDFPPGFTRSFLHRRLVDGPAPASLPPPAAKRG